MNQRPGETLTHVPQMTLDDYFAIHADLETVKEAEDQIKEARFQAGIPPWDTDMVRVRCEARYHVATMMIQVRSERELGKGVGLLLPGHEDAKEKA